MGANRWTQIEELFQAAIELDVSSRGPFLEEACGADVQLRGELESLLASHESAREFDSGALREFSAFLKPETPALWPGDRIGKYEIVRLAGAGGMGRVYLARDTQLGRQVALK